VTGQFLLLVVILAVIGAFIGVPWWMARRRVSDEWDRNLPYLSAIDALIRGRRAAAIAPLRELAQHEPENVAVYLRLGDLVRRIGYPDRAYRLHTDLLAREIDDPEDQTRIQESLLEDLLELDRPEEMKRAAERLIALDRRSGLALRALVRYHEQRGDWEKALSMLDQLSELHPGQTRPTAAQMRIQMARANQVSGRVREARRLLEEAAKMPEDGSLARVFLGDLLAEEGQLEPACEQWITYVREFGYRSEQVFARLEKAYFEMGRFGDLVQVYEGLAAGSAGNLHAAVALADMHRRRGRLEEAIRQLEMVLEAQPGLRAARRQLIGNLLQIGKTEEALKELDTLMSGAPQVTGSANCPVCGEVSEDLWVRCDRCGAWQSPARPEPPPRPPSVRPPTVD